MSTLIKSIVTIIIAIISALILLISISIAGTSHTISENSRDIVATRGFASLIIGTIVVILIWLPWKKIIK
jgi:hypothetical protein